MSYIIRNSRLNIFRIAAVGIVSVFALISADPAATAPLATRTWDGGGVTNNWSEAANWSDDSIPQINDTVIFNSTSSKSCVIDITFTAGVNSLSSTTIDNGYTGTVSFASGLSTTFFGNLTINSGTFALSDGNITHAPGALITQNGGTFNTGSGNASLWLYIQNGGTFTGSTGNVAFGAGVSSTAGTFTAPSGNLGSSGNLQVSGTFNHNNGTVTFTGTATSSTNIPAFNNVTVQKDDTFSIVAFSGSNRVIGTLTLTQGEINGGPVIAEGPVSVASGFGNTLFGGGTGTVVIESGTGPRTITIAGGSRLPVMLVNDANASVTTSGSGTILARTFTVSAGTVNAGSVNWTQGHLANPESNIAPFTLNGGSFTIGSGNFTMNTFSNFSVAGGTFNGGSGNFICEGNLILNSGTFNASSSNTTVKRGFTVQSGATFNAGAGTLVTAFNGVDSLTFTLPVAGITINNFTTNASVGLGGPLIVNGTFTQNSGTVNADQMQLRGNMVMAVGAQGGTTNLLFNGTGNQTFSNASSNNFTGTWTVNKPSGVFSLASNLTLGPSQTLNLTAGEFSQGASFDLTAGPISVGVAGVWRNNGTGDITLGGNVSNAGEIDIDGTTISCDEADAILIRSTSAGVQRIWSGAGSFFVQDADVQDQAGSAAITAHASTNVGNNGGNWTFDGQCSKFTWDGGGATNNWSEAANWKRNLVPINTLTVYFDGTSSKNAIIDSSLQVNGMRIESSYAGTISHLTNSTKLIVGSGSVAGSLIQNGGTYSPSALEVTGNTSILGGTFSPTNALKDLNGDLSVSNATYTGNGTTRLSGNLTVTTPVSFSPEPLFEFDGSTNATVSVPSGTQFAAVNIIKLSDSSLSISSGSGMTVTGELQLVDGLLDGEAVTVTGVFTTNSGFDGGNGGISIQDPSPGGTIGAPGFSPALPAAVVLNSAGATISSLGSPFFQSLIVQSGTFELSGGATVQGNYSQSGGTFRHSFANLTFDGNFTLTGGTFENSLPGGGLIFMNGDVVLNGGTFTSTSTDLSIANDFRINGATFNHNNGRVRFLSANPWSLEVGTDPLVLNRVNLEGGGLGVVESLDGTSWITTLGTVNFSAGGFELAQGATQLPSFRAEGDVSIASAFSGSGFNIRFQGSGTQSLTQQSLATFDRWAIDKAGGTINLLSDLAVPVSLTLENGTITTGAQKVTAPSTGVSQTNGFVVGSFEQTFSAPASAVFAVGTASGPSPITVNVTAAAANVMGGGPASLTVSATQGNRPGMLASGSVGRYWTITETGDITADLTFNYPQADANGNEAEYRLYKLLGPAKTEVPGNLDTTANTFFTGGISEFSDWAIGVLAPTAAPASISGRVTDPFGRGLRGVAVLAHGLDGITRSVVTNTFGRYKVEGLAAGQTYILSANSRRYSFANNFRLVDLSADLGDEDFVATP